jgi:hypothetical protein
MAYFETQVDHFVRCGLKDSLVIFVTPQGIPSVPAHGRKLAQIAASEFAKDGGQKQ